MNKSLSDRGKIILNDARSIKMRDKKRNIIMMDITLVTCFSITIFVGAYVLLFYHKGSLFSTSASRTIVLGIIALTVVIIGRRPFSFRLLKMYENGISLPGTLNVWRTITRNTADYIPYVDIKAAYPNINCPKWTITTDHFTLVEKNGKAWVIQKKDVLSTKKLAEVLNKHGKIPLITNRFFEYGKGELMPTPVEVHMYQKGFSLVFKDEKAFFGWNEIKKIKVRNPGLGSTSIYLNNGDEFNIIALHKNKARHKKISKTLVREHKNYQRRNGH